MERHSVIITKWFVNKRKYSSKRLVALKNNPYICITIMLMATHTRKQPPKCRLFLIMGVPTLELFYLINFISNE